MTQEQCQVVRGLPQFTLQMLHEMCEACYLGKSSRQPFKQRNYISNVLLDLVHMDVWGLTREISLTRNRYFVTLIDEYSRKVGLFCINKS